MKHVLVGDPHVVVEELVECQALIDFVIAVAEKEEAGAIVFMGDLYHNHALIRVEVMEFWRNAFAKIAKHGIPVIALRGNHDMPGNDAVAAHSLLAHKEAPGVTVIDEMTSFPLSGLTFIPYQSDPKRFLELAKKAPSEHVIVCHQTLDGSKYENGFYAKDGVDVSALPNPAIISGHIHTPQSFDKVWYIGAPRWRSFSDANVDRAIWVVDFEQGLGVVSKTPYNTADVCLPIYHATIDHDRHGDPYVLNGKHDILKLLGWVTADIRLDVRGTKEQLHLFEEKFRGHARMRTFPAEETRVIKVRESEGVAKSFRRFAQAQNVDDTVVAEAERRLGWA